MWQDFLFLITGIFFVFLLLPSLFSKDKPNKWTSVGISLLLLSNVVAYVSLNLKFAAATSSVSAVIWLVMFVQKVQRPKVVKTGEKRRK